ncbi:hypothetical protein DH2020_028514 [Rehmannia glutinosa]|uniref:Mitochondrial import inner membrane translocase subunit n=1 Tax=Rehmannia glutinosa TaxID=99300 RepID=A0ABR0VR89_REHGL
MDKNLLVADLSSLSEADKARIPSIVDHFQIRDSDCVDSFYRKSLGKQEENCVRRCTEKFLKHSVEVAIRFAKLNEGSSTQ